jgi:hypothetical protein
MTKRSLLLASILATCFAAHAGAEELSEADRSHDCALMRGVSVAAGALRPYIDGKGDRKYWLRTYTLIAVHTGKIASSIEKIAVPAAKSGLLQTALKELVADLRTATSSEKGDSAEYWLEAVEQQARAYGRAAAKLERLTAVVCD